LWTCRGVVFLAACGEVSCCGCVVVEIVLSEVGLKLCRPSNGPSFPGGHRREGAAGSR
jgi:hypothetical protein